MTGKTVHGLGRCILLVLLLICFATSAPAQVKPPEGAVRAANEFLEKFKQSLKSGTEFKKYVREGEDANDLTLGGVYGFYLVDGDKLAALSEGERIESSLELHTWSFTVTLGGDARMELHVAAREGGWKVIGFGGPRPAITESRAKYPASRGYVHSVAELPGLTLFALVEKDGATLLYPGTEAAAKLFEVERGTDGYYPAVKQDKALKNLKKITKEH